MTHLLKHKAKTVKKVKSDSILKSPVDPVREVIDKSFVILSDESKPPLDRFDEVEAMTAALPQFEFPVFHKFSDGQYLREGFYPAGTVIVGVEWNVGYPMFILKGKIAMVWLENGNMFSRIIEAPTYTVTQPNTRRIGIFLEDTSAVMVLRTDEITPDAVMNSDAVSKRRNPLLHETFEPAWVNANKGGFLV